LPFALWLPIFVHQVVRGVPWHVHLSIGDTINAFGLAVVYSAPALGSFAIGFIVIIALCVIMLARSQRLHSNLLLLAAFFITAIAGEIVVGATDMRYAYIVLPIAWVFFAVVLFDCWPRIKERLYSQRLRDMPALILVTLGILCVFVPDTALALRLGSLPKSGIRSLVNSTPQPPSSTVYLLAPDYLSATFAYYTRDERRPFFGFVREQHAEIFRVEGYAARWNDPQALSRAECAVARYPTLGYSRLEYIVDDNARDQGSVPYGKVWPLLHFLQTHYLETGRTNYFGLQESISDYRFSLTPEKHEIQCLVRRDGLDS